MYSDLLSNQKVNHYPGSFNFGRKDKLWMNLSTLGIRLNCIGLVDFHPATYILPNEIGLLKRQIKLNAQIKLILKPPAAARGNGIQIVNNINQIPKNARVRRNLLSTKTALIAQKYIENPLLLFNQTKFDIRMYVLITSFDPLHMYVYDDGLVRFASVEYSNDISKLNDQFMHLTNYSINKKVRRTRSTKTNRH
jgi:tubulin polyglutamylase TTLL4